MADTDSTQEIVFGPVHNGVRCVDLRATFHGKFRFEWDETYAAELPRVRKRDAAWLTVIPGDFGRMYPHGGRNLAAYTTSNATIRALQAVEGVKIKQGGTRSGEAVVVYDISLIEKVAQILHSKRRKWG